MNDPKSSYGEPVEESTNVDDVVGHAHQDLADAEAARREVAVEPVVAEPTDSGDLDPIYAQHATDDAETVVIEPGETVVIDRSGDAPTVVAHGPDADRVDAERAGAGAVVAGSVIASAASPSSREESSRDAPDYVPPAAAQPIFVQAPEQPRPRGNRGAAGAIGLLAALAFAILYLGAWLGLAAVTGAVTIDNVGSAALAALTTWALWVPVVVFFIAFWLLGGVINRGRWGLWVILGVLVGVASYGGHILGQLFQAPFWTLTAREGADVVEGQLLAPLAIAAFVFGRELTIWFGAWVSARGRRVTELNIEAQREYERTLEAGPQLVRV